jgi:CRP-like cAMP-binding protein
VRRALVASGIVSKTDPAALTRWCAQLTPVRFPPGHAIATGGDSGGRLYVIMSGKVKVSIRRLDGCEIVLTILKRHEIFGVVSLFDPVARETRITALTEVASRLLLLKRRFGHREGGVIRIVHDLTLEDFSCLVGVSPELIGKTMRDFEDRGWIRSEDTSVVIVDSEALSSYRNPMP